ncbi:hypothetical protein KTC96_00450 [Clostridium estertheticum]|nr:hypothetical protein [Clostridium estertheticum]WLC70551.1 hypothetical protein KTC96_00450 [Clostridium estertheticum]
MVITNSLIDFVANYEVYSAKPYGGVDSQNHTIGYRHVILSCENHTNLTQS